MEKAKVYFTREITPENVIKLYNLLGKEHFMERVNSRNGIHTIEAASELGFGSREYELIEV